MKTTLPTLALLASVALLGCSEGGACKEISRTEVTDPSAPLLIGGTLADVQATVGGTRSGPLEWRESEAYVRGWPSVGETEITVTILEPHRGWDVDYERSNTSRYERLYCGDYLETELEIQLQSADGVLDATILAPVSVSRVTTISVQADLTEEDLGALAWDPIEDDASLHLALTYGTLDGPLGALQLRRVESDDSGQGGVGMTVELASWTLR